MPQSEELRNALTSDCAHSMEPLLEKKQSSDFDELLNLVSFGSENRRRALFLLGVWEDSRAITPITKVLPELAEVEQMAAINALGRIGTDEAIENLAQFAKSESVDVKRITLQALGRVNTDRARNILEEVTATDPDQFVKEYARGILRRSDNR